MTPLTLLGKNLGERHHYLNNIVNEAYKRNDNFLNLEDLPEKSPVDRIFKIHLASKLRNVDYIIENLKDDDMLYVSKALKCNWLLETEFEHIINPEYLEDKLYPLMKTTAVTKMRSWVFLNLKDAERCQHFFVYYYEKNLKLSIQFLKNCSSDFVKEQFPIIIHKISPLDFKVLCEKIPEVVKIFYDALSTDEGLKAQYLTKQNIYFKILKSLLKMDTDMVLDITEKYFEKETMKCFNPNATKFIMKHHKDRFLQKPELYTALLLHLKTLANCINTEEAMDLVLKLARCKYLSTQNWFTYKSVEPLIKRLKPEDRGAFKKKVFVDKDVGEEIKELPYKLPSPPVLVEKKLPIFEDFEHYPDEYYSFEKMDFRSMLKKRKFAKWKESKASKTMLDKLFDQYRVASFDKTLFELRKKLTAESSPQIRQYMILVLVSKSGGLEKNITALMELLINFKNESPQLRAAIARSLVKRAHIWRVPDVTWKQLLEFAHGLGLDGKPPEADCTEGIHAVIIRQILLERKCDPDIFAIYLDKFSTLIEYSFSIKEKDVISNLLPNILYNNACEESKFSSAVDLINKLLDTHTAFGLPIEKYPNLITKIKSLAETDISKIEFLLKRLYKSRIYRRELFEVNFKIIKSEDSYLNALRHNTEVISSKELINDIVSYKLPYQKCLHKISIYFNEEGGLAKELLCIFKAQSPHKSLAKPLTILIGDKLELYLKNLDNTVEKKDRLFAATIRANVHLARPALNIDSFGWISIGTKAVANKVLICRDTEVDNYSQKLLQNKQTIKLALILARRKGDYIDVFTTFSNIKPTTAIKTGLKILKSHRNLSDLEVWDIIKPLLEKLKITSVTKRLNHRDIFSMPSQVKPAYSIIIYNAYKKISYFQSMHFLCHIENLLPNINNNFIENVLQEFLNDFIPKKISEEDVDDYINCVCLHIRILIKYLLLCKSIEMQEKRLKSIGAIFFDKMEVWLMSEPEHKVTFFKHYLKEILEAVLYYEVFLNVKYVSCMPVLEKTLSWIRKHLSMEKHFITYAHMQLNILYFTAIRKTIDILPEHSINDSNQIEARTMVGNIFGKYLAQEINVFSTKYFDSAIFLYTDMFLPLETYFFHTCTVFVESLINGILDQSSHSIANFVLAKYLLKMKRYYLDKNALNQIIRTIKENKNIEVQMIFSAEI